VCDIFFSCFLLVFGAQRAADDFGAVATRGDSQSVPELIGSTFGASEAWLFVIWIRSRTLLRVMLISGKVAVHGHNSYTGLFPFRSVCATRAENGRFIYTFALVIVTPNTDLCFAISVFSV
jgi:hypothetical protein